MGHTNAGGTVMFDGEDGGVVRDGAGTVEDAVTVGGRDAGGAGRAGWREIDRQLRRVAKARARVDADELIWLARADAARVHERVGCATVYEYVERVLGYPPRVARERLRVARALTELSGLAAELESGRQSFSAVRELSRVATVETEEAWIGAAAGRCVREIEELVAGRQRGDQPKDRRRPDLIGRPIELILTPAALALFRQASDRLEEECGQRLSDSQRIEAMCLAVLEGGAPAAERRDGTGGETEETHVGSAEARGEPAADEPVPDPDTKDDDDGEHEDDRGRGHGRAPFQIALTRCVDCRRTWVDAAGRSVDASSSLIAMARCDAQHLGRLDVPVWTRTTQDISPRKRDKILRRDRFRCTAPGCRATRWLHVHHIIPRSQGGTNDAWNLTTVCQAHHGCVHDDRVILTGKAPYQLSWRRVAEERVRHDEAAEARAARPVEPRPEAPVETSDGELVGALVGLGWKQPLARAAVARARAHLGEAPLEELLRRAIQEAGQPARP